MGCARVHYCMRCMSLLSITFNLISEVSFVIHGVALMSTLPSIGGGMLLPQHSLLID